MFAHQPFPFLIDDRCTTDRGPGVWWYLPSLVACTQCRRSHYADFVDLCLMRGLCDRCWRSSLAAGQGGLEKEVPRG